LNAAYALHVSDQYADLDACLEAAAESIDSGAALDALNTLASVSKEAKSE